MKVSSPDPLADDPDRWRRLFAQFGHVSYVTVARGNGSLLRAMAERRVAGKVLEGSTSNTSEVSFPVFRSYLRLCDDSKAIVLIGADDLSINELVRCYLFIFLHNSRHVFCPSGC